MCLKHDIRDEVMRGTRTGPAHSQQMAPERSLDIEMWNCVNLWF
jgi:hypothetical protein